MLSILLMAALGGPMLDTGEITGEPNKLIEIRASVSPPEGFDVLSQEWLVFDPAVDWRQYENGTVFVATAPPGTYQARWRAQYVDWENRLGRSESRVYTIVIRGPPGPNPPGPGPTPPGPGPTPPGPNPPGPEPDDPQSAQVYRWAVEVLGDESQAVAKQVATVYRSAGASLLDGRIPTVAKANDKIRSELTFPSQKVRDEYVVLAGRINNDIYPNLTTKEEIGNLYINVAKALEAL